METKQIAKAIELRIEKDNQHNVEQKYNNILQDGIDVRKSKIEAISQAIDVLVGYPELQDDLADERNLIQQEINDYINEQRLLVVGV